MAIGWDFNLASCWSGVFALMLSIEFSGGMGVAYQGEVDLSALPASLHERALDLLSESNLNRLSTVATEQTFPGATTYTFHYCSSERSFVVDEGQASPEFLQLMDELNDYLILRPKNS